MKTVNSLTNINSFYENFWSSHTLELNFNKLNSWIIWQCCNFNAFQQQQNVFYKVSFVTATRNRS